MRIPTALAIGLMAFLPANALGGADQDQVGYYYPEITSEEHFTREVANPEPGADRETRIQFLIQFTSFVRQGREPRFEIYAKGRDAEHMIIVALDDTVFRSLFRARGVLAGLTAEARQTDFMIVNQIDSTATWFDLAKLLGFADIVVTDGIAWSHRVALR